MDIKVYIFTDIKYKCLRVSRRIKCPCFSTFYFEDTGVFNSNLGSIELNIIVHLSNELPIPLLWVQPSFLRDQPTNFLDIDLSTLSAATSYYRKRNFLLIDIPLRACQWQIDWINSMRTLDFSGLMFLPVKKRTYGF